MLPPSGTSYDHLSPAPTRLGRQSQALRLSCRDELVENEAAAARYEWRGVDGGDPFSGPWFLDHDRLRWRGRDGETVREAFASRALVEEELEQRLGSVALQR